MLANDSCYLVQPFDQVFARMDAEPADWWGLQATYDDFDRPTGSSGSAGRCGSTRSSEQMRELDLWRYSDFIHVGSYFLGYRSRVIRDPEFRRRLDTVATQSDKTAIILKYEIGFSRYLILAGYHLATFVDGVLPFHPVYRDSAFDLMARRLPAAQAPVALREPVRHARPARGGRSGCWRRVPDADVDAMERNLLRVSPPWSLHRSFASAPARRHVETAGAVGPDEFADEERWTPKHDHWWAFAVDPVTHRLEGSARAVFEAVRYDPSIQQDRADGVGERQVAGVNVVAPRWRARPASTTCCALGNIFVTEGPRADVDHPLSGRAPPLRRAAPRHAAGRVRRGRAGARHRGGRSTSAGPGHDNDITYAVVTSSRRTGTRWRAPFAPARRMVCG